MIHITDAQRIRRQVGAVLVFSLFMPVPGVAAEPGASERVQRTPIAHSRADAVEGTAIDTVARANHRSPVRIGQARRNPQDRHRPKDRILVQVWNDADALRNRIDDLQSELRRNKIEIEELQIKNRNLSSLLDASELEIEGLRSEKGELLKKIQNDAAKQGLGSELFEESQRMNEELRNENDQLESHVKQMKNEIAGLRQAISQPGSARNTPSLPTFVSLAPAEVAVPRIGVDGVIFDTAGTRKTQIGRVRISLGPVLVGDFRKFCRDTGHNCTDLSGRNDTEAVSMIRWIDAAAYVDWLSSATGQRFRLPSYVELLIAPTLSNDRRMPEFAMNQYRRDGQLLVAVMDSRTDAPTTFRDRFLLVGSEQVVADTTFRLVSDEDQPMR